MYIFYDKGPHSLAGLGSARELHNERTEKMTKNCEELRTLHTLEVRA